MSQENRQNATLRRLEALVGEWSIEITLPGDPPTKVVGQSTCEWLESGNFLLERSSAEQADFPTSYAIIGCDDVLGTYSILYSDSRDVRRLYAMSFDGTVWKQWRNEPGFFQRFTGTFSDDGSTITAKWEQSTDGATWELDFDLLYTKITAE